MSTSQSHPQSRKSQQPLTRAQAQALLHLLEAFESAEELRQPVLQFSCQLRGLHDHGFTDANLRWLLALGYADHLIETTKLEEKERHFRSIANSRFTEASCLVLTARGARRARTLLTHDHALLHTHSQPPERKPHFDLARRQLYLGEVLVKSYSQPAKNQVTILASFQEEGWPPRLDDPLPGNDGVDARRRLNEAIRSLNAHQQARRLDFRGDGTGTAILWNLLS